jgi:arylsulfatase A-like enzyme
MIDEKIGQILEALEAQGYLEDAIVIFTSDHGDCLSDHGHSQKWTMYDVITRMPLIVWAPGRFAGGQKLDGLCQQMDIAPALLELAGVTVPETMEAQSLLPALRGESWDGRDYIFAEHPRDGILQTTDFMTMVRSKEWKLVHFLDEPFGQLFDLTQDPGETRNLWDDPATAAKKQELLHVLLEWHIRSQSHTQDWPKAWR